MKGFSNKQPSPGCVLMLVITQPLTNTAVGLPVES